jgi:endo-1,4-beta-xylanase
MKRPALRHLAENRNLLIGAACSPETIEAEADYRRVLAREFNCIVGENCMKFAYLQPEFRKFDFSRSRKLAEFARKHKMKLRGHTLVWHSQLSDWLTSGSFTRTGMLDVLQEHIHTVAGHFRGDVFAWDVVNEGLSDEGGWRKESPWHRKIGPAYLEHAFRWAHEADPDAQLFYNDYGMELPGKKSDGCYKLVSQLLRKGVPIHGVGFQFHLGAENRLDKRACMANIRRFNKLGLTVHFTEMDMGMKKPITDETRREQAEEYASRLQIALDAPDVSAVLFWGFTDRHSWLPAFTKGQYDEGLIFDRDCRGKPAYRAIRAVLAE